MLGHWRDSCAAASAESVFAEVTANVTRHARTRAKITVRISAQEVRCDVRDRSWRLPRPLRPCAPVQENGRGLLIVASLASAWGVRRHLLGKSVWFIVKAVPGPTREGASAQ